MAFSMSKFNKGAKFSYSLPDGASFKKLEDLGEGFTGIVKAVGISHKGKYGDSPLLLSDGYGVWLPKHMMDTINAIMQDPEAVDAINNGGACFNVRSYTYTDAQGAEKCGLSVDFVDSVPVQ